MLPRYRCSLEGKPKGVFGLPAFRIRFPRVARPTVRRRRETRQGLEGETPASENAIPIFARE
jgi:hypothetical protein